jgi:hypothetical protein
MLIKILPSRVSYLIKSELIDSLIFLRTNLPRLTLSFEGYLE